MCGLRCSGKDGLPTFQGCILGFPVVSFWGSGTLKIVIYVENQPQKRGFCWLIIIPLWVGVLISGRDIICIHTIYIHIGGKQRTSR